MVANICLNTLIAFISSIKNKYIPLVLECMCIFNCIALCKLGIYFSFFNCLRAYLEGGMCLVVQKNDNPENATPFDDYLHNCSFNTFYYRSQMLILSAIYGSGTFVASSVNLSYLLQFKSR